MAPSAVDVPMPDAESQTAIPPPQLYAPKELHFEKYLDVQPDGYRRAVSRPAGEAAIVIDNGKWSCITAGVYTKCQKLTHME
jgi:actin-related protein 5